MGSERYPIRQNGIYHNLPQFDPKIKDLTAIVTGANGISGFHTCRALLESPDRWEKIYAMSRRPPPDAMMALLTREQRRKIEHVSIDFLQNPKEVAEAMKNAGVERVDYVFFYSYLQPRPPPGSPAWSNDEELVEVNSALLRNFLSALPLCSLHPRRILLQTGAKNYGSIYGRSREPCIESDPQPSHLAPNFYYSQEALLFQYCKEHSETGWNIIMPSWIIGATTNAQMNAYYAFSVYAAVAAKRSLPLVFPGDWTTWQGLVFHSSARLTGYLSEWAVLEDKCANQRFNSTDTGAVTWDRWFERFAEWFGITAGVQPPSGNLENPVVVTGLPGEKSPIGYGPPVENKSSFTFQQWALDPENRKAWNELMAESDGLLTHDPFEDGSETFVFGDAALPVWGRHLSSNKARRLGWTGFVDTVEGVFEMYWEMGGDGRKGMGMVSAMKVKEARPLV
ncbi:hypothetical protein LTR84_010674 [Exophiala bonariae]|uniref:PRISE-like Rossmann-fold domain-containing protein n=1 Tax=Exophiala bonariae TaxID=1690606 RepID=A0AAV9MSR4_9EURO|nr:hypothetical protein LTR84_010674 [Exophiala bonariae]